MSSRLFRSARYLLEGTRFPNLTRFARKNQTFEAALSALAPTRGRGRVDQAIVGNANRFAAEGDYALLTTLLDALRPFLNPDQSPDARDFWDALVADCRAITEDRLRSGEMNSLWGVTPIVNLTSGVAADRALGVNARSLVFTTYHTSSNFDFVCSEIQARLVAERGEDWFLFRWLMLIWAIANLDRKSVV